MNQLNDDEKRRLFQTLDKHTEQNDNIERGLYGDKKKKNKVPGAIDDIAELRNEIGKINSWINKHNLKTAYISGGVATGVIFCKMAWDWITLKTK